MTRKPLVLAVLGLTLLIFAAGAWLVTRSGPAPEAVVATPERAEMMIRAYSPVLGPEDAPVTIVEFFDPSCEACRAMHPVVKSILERYPEEVRVIVRYTPFHGEGSELAIKVLEAARLQGVFLPVMDALLQYQPVWASHDAPAAERIMDIAGAAGLDVELAEQQIKSPEIVGVLNQDRADVQALGIRQTPTFFVNSKPLPEFGVRQLLDLVQSEVEAARAS